jgi:hypothetical protein
MARFFGRIGGSIRTPGPLQSPPFRIPGDNRLNLLGCERWEKEAGIPRLPRGGLRFIQDQSEQVLMRPEGLERFVKNRLFGSGDPRQNPTARRQAAALDGGCVPVVPSVLVCIVPFHLFRSFPLYVTTNVT